MISQQRQREKMNNVRLWSHPSPLRTSNYLLVKVKHCLKITNQREKLFLTFYISLLWILVIAFFFNLFILFIYFWPHCVFVAACGLSLVAVSGGYSSVQCTGFSLRWLLLLWSTGSRHKGFSICGVRASVVVAHGLSCSAACGIFPDQGSNPCPLHWQAYS